MMVRARVNGGICCRKYECSTSLDNFGRHCHKHSHEHVLILERCKLWLSIYYYIRITVSQPAIIFILHMLICRIHIRSLFMCLFLFFKYFPFQISHFCPGSDRIKNMYVNILFAFCFYNRLKFC